MGGKHRRCLLRSDFRRRPDDDLRGRRQEPCGSRMSRCGHQVLNRTISSSGMWVCRRMASSSFRLGSMPAYEFRGRSWAGSGWRCKAACAGPICRPIRNSWRRQATGGADRSGLCSPSAAGYRIASALEIEQLLLDFDNDDPAVREAASRGSRALAGSPSRLLARRVTTDFASARCGCGPDIPARPGIPARSLTVGPSGRGADGQVLSGFHSSWRRGAGPAASGSGNVLRGP